MPYFGEIAFFVFLHYKINVIKMAMRKTEVLLVVNLLMDGWSG